MIAPRALYEAIATDRDSLGANESFRVRLAVEGAFLARAPSNRVCLLIPTLAPRTVPLGRVCGAVTLSFEPDILFVVGGREWRAPSAVLECLDDAFLPAFCALAADLASRLTTGTTLPACTDVVSSLAQWERLFRSRKRLTDSEELGLWAELSLMLRLTDLDAAIRAWRGPFGDSTDFFSNGVGIECKSSRRRLRLTMSLSQAGRPRGDFDVYVASLWVDTDPHAGTTLADVVRQVEASTNEAVVFEKALLASGYSRADQALYRQRFVLLHDPWWFVESSVPTIRSMDPGVSEVRYVADLDESLALNPFPVQELLARFAPRS